MSKLKILTVCTGNICRSPMGEGVLRDMAAKNNLQWYVESCAVRDYHIGETPDPRAMKACEERGYDISDQRARQIRPDDFLNFDLILAMDNGHMEKMRHVIPQNATAKIALYMCQTSRPSLDVFDPYYGDEQGFFDVLDLLEEGALAWVKFYATRP